MGGRWGGAGGLTVQGDVWASSIARPVACFSGITQKIVSPLGKPCACFGVGASWSSSGYTLKMAEWPWPVCP